METKMQTSFIPKKPIVESKPSGSGISLFLLLAIIVFIVALAMAGFVWMWKQQLVKQIETHKKELADAKNSYTDGNIEELIRLDDRIKEADSLLKKHLAVTPVFALLEREIVKNVQLTTMKFVYGGENKIRVDLSGIAKNYDALSRQSDAFGDQKLRNVISQPVVSDFNLNADGTVSFRFSALVSSDLVSYQRIIEETTTVSTTTNEINTPNIE